MIKKSVCVVVIGENFGTFEIPEEDFWTTIKGNSNTSVQSQNNQTQNGLSFNNNDAKIETNANESKVPESEIKPVITSESIAVLPGHSEQVCRSQCPKHISFINFMNLKSY